jgi:RimJ/RimL family protein N-acetyltransferase
MSPTQRVRFVIRAVANVVAFTIVGFIMSCALWAVIVVVFDPPQSVVRLLLRCVVVSTALGGVAAFFRQFRGRRVVMLPTIGLDLSDPTLRVRLRSVRPDDVERLETIHDAIETFDFGSPSDDVLPGKHSPVPDRRPLVATAAVVGSSTDAVAGLVFLRSDAEDRSCCEFDWMLHPDVWGEGLGQEVVALVGRLAAQLGFVTLRIVTNVTDVAMQQSAEAGGASFVGEGLRATPNGEALLSRWYEMPLRAPVIIAE